uniref:Uncharacterized protein n=1 Tax=Populus trichocarpa TaxID=3694 RepID=A0A2K1XUR3_POPTR
MLCTIKHKENFQITEQDIHMLKVQNQSLVAQHPCFQSLKLEEHPTQSRNCFPLKCAMHKQNEMFTTHFQICIGQQKLV